MRFRSLNKKIAFVVLLSMLIVMLFSAVYVTEYTHHIFEEHQGNHQEEDCPICAIIMQCSHNLKELGNTLVVLSCILMTLFVVNTKKDSISEVSSINTLISLKIRMNN